VPEKVVIIIPTYNERENISMIIPKLENIFLKIPNYEMNILIFDSNSPDGTAEGVKDFQKKYNNIFLLTETEKSGLGNAYIQAMTYADAQLHADIIFEFDADGSHNPDYLPEMMKAFDYGATVVTGSRYILGGSIPANWAFHRKVLSVLGNLIARLLLTFSLKDFTTGFRGTRITALQKINLATLKSKGYAYKIHLLWQLYRQGEKIEEVPIHFIDRNVGVSKLPKNNIIESLMMVMLLRWKIIKKYILW